MILVIPIGILAAILSLPIVLVKLTEIENIPNHWWNEAWEEINREGTSYYDLLGLVTLSKLALVFVLIGPSDFEYRVFFVVAFIFSIVGTVFNKAVVHSHSLDKKLRMYTGSYLGFLVLVFLSALISSSLFVFFVFISIPISALWIFRIVIGISNSA